MSRPKSSGASRRLHLRAGRETLPYVLETIGCAGLMYASDYAHWDSEFAESVRKTAELPLKKDDQRRILGQNAIHWFNLQPKELPGPSIFFEPALLRG